MILSETYKKRLKELAGLNEDYNRSKFSPAMQQTIEIIKERLLSSPFDQKHIDLIHKYLKEHPDWFSTKETLGLKVVAGDIVKYDGGLELEYLPIRHLGNLKSVGQSLLLHNVPITNLGKNLKFIGGNLWLNSHIREEDLPKDLVVKGKIFVQN